MMLKVWDWIIRSVRTCKTSSEMSSRASPIPEMRCIGSKYLGDPAGARDTRQKRSDARETKKREANFIGLTPQCIRNGAWRDYYFFIRIESYGECIHLHRNRQY